MQQPIQTKQNTRTLALILAILTVLCLILTIFSLSYPLMRKSNAIKEATNSTVGTLEVVSTSFSAISSNSLTSLVKSPTAYPQYFQSTSTALTSVKNALGYSRLLIATTYQDQPTVVADSAYVVGGDQHFAAGTTLPNDLYKGCASIFAKLLDGSATYDYSTSELTPTLVSIYVPMFNQASESYAVLICDYQLENTAYNMLGGINLNVFGMWTLLATIIFGGLTYLSLRYHLPMKKQKLLQEPVPVEAGEKVAEPATLFNQQGDDLPIEPYIPPENIHQDETQPPVGETPLTVEEEVLGVEEKKQ